MNAEVYWGLLSIKGNISMVSRFQPLAGFIRTGVATPMPEAFYPVMGATPSSKPSHIGGKLCANWEWFWHCGWWEPIWP